MPTNAATRKPRASKPRETAAQKRARIAAEQTPPLQGVDAAFDTPTPTPIAPGVSRVSAAPDVPGGAPSFSSEDAPPEEREVLFHYDGVGYTIPKHFGYTKALAYAHVGRTQGPTAAVDWAMEMALGTVGYQVLLTSAGIPDAECEKLVAFVIGRVEGLPDPKP